MEIVLLFILLLLICPADASGGNHSHSERRTTRNYHSNKRSSGKGSREYFEEADSFFDIDGNEHLVDDDGYCEDCDDYLYWN